MSQPSLFSQPSPIFDPKAVTIAPSRHVQARETSALAALVNLPKKGTQNEMILGLITAAGNRGLSDLELHTMTGIRRQSICARRRDLGELIEPAADRHTDNNTGISYTRWRRKS